MTNSLKKAACWLVLINLAGMMPLSAAPQNAPPLAAVAQLGAADAKLAQAAPATPAERIAIVCVKVLDHEPMPHVVRAMSNFVWDSVEAKAGTAAEPRSGTANRTSATGRAVFGDCDPAAPPLNQKLVGTGDLVVSVALTDRVALSQPALKPLELFVNGVPLGDNAKLVATEDSDNQRHYRYYIAPGKLSNNLWAAIFREEGLYNGTSLRAGLGWSGEPHSYPLGSAFRGNTIQISDIWRIALASILILAFIVAWVYVIRTTDVFRDASAPTAQALDGTAAQPDMEPLAVPHLVRSPPPGDGPRASYSLGRLQFGLWLLFAVGVGVFLWVVYGDLPGLESSIITILSLSTAVTAASLYVDKQAEKNRYFTASQGFWHDITTGFDEKQKVYRYQAVVVNLLLLFIGVYQVINQLTYPTFDPTWLALLGLSGVFFAAGKNMTEGGAPLEAAPEQALAAQNAQSPPMTAPAGSAQTTKADALDTQDPDLCVDGCDAEVKDATPDEELPAAAGGIRR